MIIIGNTIHSFQTTALYDSFGADVQLTDTRVSADAGTREPSSQCLDDRLYDLRFATYPIGTQPSIAIIPQSYRNGVVYNELPVTRTNFIQNNTMTGATGSAAPTTWTVVAPPSGITIGYSASGQTTAADGTLVDYIDVTVSGTALASGNFNLRPEPVSSTVSGNLLFAAGVTYTVSFYMSLLSGSVSGVSPNYQIQEVSGTTFVSGTSLDLSAITSNLTRYSVTRPIVGTGADRIRTRYGHAIGSGQVLNYTVRIASPQLEKGSVATPIIRTVSGFVTVQDMVQGAQDVNLAFHSQTWATGTNWFLTNTTTATGTTGTLDPLGTNTANAISPTAANDSHFLASNNPTAVSYTSGTIYTQSAFFKQGTGAAGRYVQLTFPSARFTQLGYANFDLQTGALVASGGTADANRAASIENYGNGWYRCRFTATCNSGGTGVGVIPVLITASGDTRALLFTGVTGDVLYGWGAQVEVGSTATPYIPTTTSARARAAYDGAPPDFTFTRATTATRVNASGLIESVASGVLRLDYPVTGGCPAALIEASGTNLLLRSEEFTVSGTWTSATGGTGVAPIVTQATGIVDPAGGNTADLIQLNVGSGTLSTDFSILRQSITVTSVAHTFSVYLRSATSGNQFVAIRFDSAPQTILTITPSWQRFTFTGTPTAGSRDFGFDLRGNNTSASGSTQFYAWGAQLETGAIPTSYIPTTTASATRNAEVCTVSGVSGYIGQTEGTIYAEVDVRNLAIETYIIRIDEGASSNNITLRKLNTNQIRTAIVAPTTSGTLNISSAAFTAGIIKIAFAYKSGEIALSVNGATPLTANGTFAFGAPLNRITLGSNQSPSSEFNDRLRAAAIYTTRLDNTTLANITRLT